MACGCAETLGYVVILYIAVKLALRVWNIVHPFFIAKRVDDLVSYSGGKWAVVTGSTDGIGKAYALELATHGMNVCLIARNDAKLKDVEKDIVAQSPKADVHRIVFDFTNAAVSDYEDMWRKSELHKLDIGILVNNVGMSLEHPEYLLNVPSGMQRSRDIVAVNCIGAVMLTHLAMPAMKERKRGVIVNISSGTDMFPAPLLTVYAASKAFMAYFTKALQAEYANSGVFIQVVAPFFVATKMAKVRRSRGHNFIPDPSEYAKAAVGTIGIHAVTHGFWPHQLQGELLAMLPTCLVTLVSTKVLSGVRANAISRAAKSK